MPLTDDACHFSNWELFDPGFETDVKWVRAVAHIRCNATGEVREHATAVWLENGAPNPSSWEDGNYSCDCNRGLFFAREGGIEPDDDDECSDGKFSVNLENPITGEVFYREFCDASHRVRP